MVFLLTVLEILQEIRCNQQQNEFIWIYGQKSKHVKIRCDSQWHVRLRLNRFITQVPSGASLSPSCEAPAMTTANTKLISIVDLYRSMIDNVMNITDLSCKSSWVIESTVFNSSFIVKSFDHWNIPGWPFPVVSPDHHLGLRIPSSTRRVTWDSFGTPWNVDRVFPAGVSPACNLPPTFPRVQRGRDSVKFQLEATPRPQHGFYVWPQKGRQNRIALWHWSAKFRFRWHFKIFSHLQLEILRCWLRQDVGLRHTAKVHQPGCSGMFKEVEEVLQWFDWIAIDSID